MATRTYRVVTKHNHADVDWNTIETLKSLGMVKFKGSQAIQGGRRFTYVGVDPTRG